MKKFIIKIKKLLMTEKGLKLPNLNSLIKISILLTFVIFFGLLVENKLEDRSFRKCIESVIDYNSNPNGSVELEGFGAIKSYCEAVSR